MSHETKQPYIHPMDILLTLVLGSITALFMGFSVAYIYSRFQSGQSPVQIPILFYVNTFFLLGTSYLFILTRRAYIEDKSLLFKKLLWVILVLSLGFLLSQILAWSQMIQLNQTITSGTMSSYLYILSGIHFIHVIGGLPFLIHFAREAEKRLKLPESMLLYFSDPSKERHLRMLTTYWHFIDVLWIYLLIFLMINRWIS